MNGRTPAYYRARLDIFRHFIKDELPGHPELDTGKKNSPLELLKQGFVHPSLKNRFEGRIDSFPKLEITLSNAPLTFTELCSFNTWFAIHPEKVAGTEVVTTSINFPVTIKGNKGTIENTLRIGLQDNKPKRIRINSAKAAAKLKLLELVHLSGTEGKILINSEDALQMSRKKGSFSKILSWYKKGIIENNIYEAKGHPDLKLIDVGEGTLLLDLKHLTLSYFYGKYNELRVIRR